MTNIFLHNFNPILLDFGSIKLTYYGLSYAIGVILGLVYLKKINKRQKLAEDKILDEVITYAILGIILGGRLGYVIFYNPLDYLEDPMTIFETWKGGMSFHGGLIGFLLAIVLYCRKYKLEFWKVMDLMALVAPIGLFFGRVANFINGELYGRATNGDWGVIFPYGGDFPRHPSQLYEAFLEGMVMFICLNILYYKTDIYKESKVISGLFLIMYGAFRILVEVFREPDQHIGIVGFLTMGQILSLPMIFIGICLLYRKILPKNYIKA